MNIEYVDSVFAHISNFQYIIRTLYKDNEDSVDLERRLFELLSFPVTSKSKFQDSIWNYTADCKVAKTVDPTRLIIDFNVYANVPESIKFELKVVLMYIKILPRQSQKSGRKNGSSLSVQTFLPMAKSWLNFMNYIFEEISREYGNEFAKEEYSSLMNFTIHDYRKFSVGFIKTQDSFNYILRVFNWFSYEHISKVLFCSQPFLPKASHLSITIAETVRDNRDKVIRDEIFEKIVAISSYLICDFLKKIGMQIKDKLAESRLGSFHYDVSRVNLNVTLYDIEYYIGKRLYKSTYNMEFVKNEVDLKLLGDIRATDFKKTDMHHEYIFRYTKMIHDAATYIVAQFTGMRPSELLEIRADKSLTSSFDIPCITSIVHKKRSVSRRLFDDLWVAIPAVEDAMSALAVLTRIRNNPYIFSRSETLGLDEEPKPLSTSISYVLKNYFSEILTEDEIQAIDFFPYMMRHTLAYQMYKVNLGLPFISHQLKHFGNLVQAVGSASNKGFSMDTMSYGDIGDMLSGMKADKNNLRHQAEVYVVKEMYDPNGSFAGVNAEAHKKRLKKLFEGYQSAGYSNEEVFEAMAKQGIAVVNVGTGMCYGGRAEDFDESLPCIGSLRCNPNRCHQAVITKAHIPKWREVYEQNLKVINLGETEPNYLQAVEAVNEAKGVLEYLGVFE